MVKRKITIAIFLVCVIILSFSGCDIANGLINKAVNNSAVDELERAIQYKNVEYMIEVAEANPTLDVNYVNKYSSLYFTMFKSGTIGKLRDVKIIKALLDLGADPNIDDVLMLTTFNAQYGEYTEALLTSDKIDIEKRSSTGSTALECAMCNTSGGCEYENYNQVLQLVAAGAKPYKELFWGYGYEEYPEFTYDNVWNSPYSTTLLLNMFLDEGGESGFLPAVEYALCGDIESAVTELESLSREEYKEYSEYDIGAVTQYCGYFGTVEQYLRLKAITGIQMYQGNLSFFAETGNLEIIKYMIEEEGMPVYTEPYQETIEWAAIMGHADVCQYLCDIDVQLNYTGLYGYIELSNAVETESLDCVKVIYNCIKERNGEFTETNLGEAYSKYYLKDIDKAKEIADFFFSEGYDFRYAELKFVGYEFAKYLYDNGRPLNPADIRHAVESDDPKYVKMVLEHGADPNQNAIEFIQSDEWDVAEDGSTLTYEQYIRLDTAANDPTYELDIFEDAIFSFSHDVVQTLINGGADIANRDCMDLARRGSKATARVLLEAGADTSIIYVDKNGNNLTLREYYEKYDRQDLIELLDEYGVE